MLVNRWIMIGVSAAAMIALAGCGTTPQASSSSTTSGQPSAASTPSVETSVSSTTTPSPTASSSSSATSGGGDSASKPSKSDTVEGLAKFYQNNQHLSSGKAQKFATCMVGQMYDKAGPATITAMKNGNPSQIDKSDRSLLAKSAVTCQSALS